MAAFYGTGARPSDPKGVAHILSAHFGVSARDYEDILEQLGEPRHRRATARTAPGLGAFASAAALPSIPRRHYAVARDEADRIDRDLLSRPC
jgi:hypothetical protein